MEQARVCMAGTGEPKTQLNSLRNSFFSATPPPCRQPANTTVNSKCHYKFYKSRVCCGDNGVMVLGGRQEAISLPLPPSLRARLLGAGVSDSVDIEANQRDLATGKSAHVELLPRAKSPRWTAPPTPLLPHPTALTIRARMLAGRLLPVQGGSEVLRCASLCEPGWHMAGAHARCCCLAVLLAHAVPTPACSGTVTTSPPFHAAVTAACCLQAPHLL